MHLFVPYIFKVHGIAIYVFGDPRLTN
jgi:hypothetical protein